MVFGQIYLDNRYDFNQGGDGGYSIIDVDTGYLVEGGTTDSLFNYQVAIWLLDENGMEIWRKSYGQIGHDFYSGYPGSFIKTQDGGYALGNSLVDSSGQNFIMLMRFDANADTLWTRKFGGGGNFYSGFRCQQSPDTGFIIIGVQDLGGGQDILIIKTDSLGNLEWQQTYGGSGKETGTAIDVCEDGGYILGGNTASFGAGEADTYIIKIDSLGNEEWSKTFGGPLWECVGNVKQTSDGGFIVGTCLVEYVLSGSYNQSRATLIKLDSSGNVEWNRGYGPARYLTGLINVYELSDGGFLSVGQRNDGLGTPAGNGWPEGTIFKVNAKGDSIWYRTYEHLTGPSSFNYLLDLKLMMDGGFITAGFCNPTAPDVGTQDMWAMRLDSCGCKSPLCDVDPQATFSFTLDSLTGTFVNMSQDANKYFWNYGDGNTSNDTNSSHTYAGEGEFIVTMIAKNCTRADTVVDTVLINFTEIVEEQADYSLTIYPNPTEGFININSSLTEVVRVTLSNTLGELVYKADTVERNIDLSGLPSGVYMFQVDSGSSGICRRIIKL